MVMTTMVTMQKDDNPDTYNQTMTKTKMNDNDDDDDDDDYDDNPQRISTEQQRPINNKPFQGGVGVRVRVGGNYPNTTSKPSPSLFYPLSFTLLSDSFWLSGL